MEPILRFEGDQPISLVINNDGKLFEPSEKRLASIISWCPPIQNWNPWLGSNIDDGPLATVSLEFNNNAITNQTLSV